MTLVTLGERKRRKDALSDEIVKKVTHWWDSNEIVKKVTHWWDSNTNHCL